MAQVVQMIGTLMQAWWSWHGNDSTWKAIYLLTLHPMLQVAGIKKSWLVQFQPLQSFIDQSLTTKLSSCTWIVCRNLSQVHLSGIITNSFDCPFVLWVTLIFPRGRFKKNRNVSVKFPPNSWYRFQICWETVLLCLLNLRACIFLCVYVLNILGHAFFVIIWGILLCSLHLSACIYVFLYLSASFCVLQVSTCICVFCLWVHAFVVLWIWVHAFDRLRNIWWF